MAEPGSGHRPGLGSPLWPPSARREALFPGGHRALRGRRRAGFADRALGRGTDRPRGHTAGCCGTRWRSTPTRKPRGLHGGQRPRSTASIGQTTGSATWLEDHRRRHTESDHPSRPPPAARGGRRACPPRYRRPGNSATLSRRNCCTGCPCRPATGVPRQRLLALIGPALDAVRPQFAVSPVRRARRRRRFAAVGAALGAGRGRRPRRPGRRRPRASRKTVGVDLGLHLQPELLPGAGSRPAGPCSCMARMRWSASAPLPR